MMLAAAAQTLALSAWGNDGLSATLPESAWPRWHTRMVVGTTDATPRALSFGRESGTGLRSASVMSDYYFARSTWSPSTQGGFRASGGMFFGSRFESVASSVPISAVQPVGWNRQSPYSLTPVEATQGLTATPYVGVGYTALSGRGGWGFSADLGVFSQGMKLGQSVGARQGLDDMLRDMRFAPLMRVGVSYSF
jgi:hypothetical protein